MDFEISGGFRRDGDHFFVFFFFFYFLFFIFYFLFFIFYFLFFIFYFLFFIVLVKKMEEKNLFFFGLQRRGNFQDDFSNVFVGLEEKDK